MSAPTIERRIRTILEAYAALDGCDYGDISVDCRWVRDRWQVALCDRASASQILPHGEETDEDPSLERALVLLAWRVLDQAEQALRAVQQLRGETPAREDSP